MRREIQDLAKQKNEEATTTDADSSKELRLAFSEFTDYLKEEFR